MLRIEELDTPSLICDLDVMEANLKLMAERCRALGIALRPHTKSHKIPALAHLQIASGAQGITCQKLGDAEVMAAAGIDDILIPYNIVGKVKTERLARLARQIRVLVAIDSEATASGISAPASEIGAAVGILIELDTGSHRCGVQNPEEAAALARSVARFPGLQFTGLMTYPSRLEAKPFIDRTVALIRQAGLEVSVISGGGTGLESVSKELGCTETRSGSYLWEGGSRVGKSEDLHPSHCPLRVLTVVVSTAVPGQMILDAGQKTLTARPGDPYGYIVEDPGAKIRGMSMEHGHVDIRECSRRFQVGDRVSVIPLHGETTTNLHDTMYGVRKGVVEAIWKIAGRGRVQ
ncbi:MAG: alanine racemase [Planctomycetes bacterium]|nr:alanine racemase [Planctomycetota bacterium]